LRFRLREALRPLELRRLLSLGATLSESLSTRLDSVRAPDLLWDRDEERLDPDEDRVRELLPERFFVADDRLFDFEDEALEPPERLLLFPDRDPPCGILRFLPGIAFVTRLPGRRYRLFLLPVGGRTVTGTRIWPERLVGNPRWQNALDACPRRW
jgi:hypothetical protein